MRGGSLFDSSNTLQSLFQDPSVPSDVNLDIGFRLARVSESTNFLLGDFNRDGHVNTADISVMLNVLTDISQYKTILQYSDAQMLSIGDLNGDGKLNNADLQGLLNLLKSGGGSLTSVPAVPEPASIIYASLGLLMLVSLRICRIDSALNKLAIYFFDWNSRRTMLDKSQLIRSIACIVNRHLNRRTATLPNLQDRNLNVKRTRCECESVG